MSINTKLILYRLFEYALYVGGFILVAWQTSVLCAVGVAAVALAITLSDIRIRNV